MTKRGKNAWILGLTALVVIGLLVGVKLLKNNAAEESAEEASGKLLLAIDPVDSYTLTYDGETYSFEKSGDSWQVKEYDGISIDQTYPETLISALAEVHAVRELGKVENRSEFGLDPAECTLVIQSGDTAYTVYIGKAGTAGNDYYLALDGEEEIYLVDSALGNAAKHDITVMIDKDELPTLSNVTLLDYGENEILYREDGSDAVYTDEYTWFWQNREEGTETVLGNEEVEGLIDALSDLSWNGIEGVIRADTDLTACGLGEDAYQVRIDYTRTETTVATDPDGEETSEEVSTPATFKLTLGSRFEDGEGNQLIYAMIPGSGLLYSMDASVMDTLENAALDALRPTDVLRMNWSTVDSIAVSAGGVSRNISITSKEVTDEDGNQSVQYTYSTGDTALDTTLTETFINYLSDMTAEGTTETPETFGETELEMELYRNTGDAFSRMEFSITAYDQNFSLVSFNGESRILVSKKDVQELLLHFRNIK